MSNRCECKSLFRKLGKLDYQIITGRERTNGGESYFISRSKQEEHKKELVEQLKKFQCW